MHKMEDLREKLCEELDEISKGDKITLNSLDAIDKLTHSIKSIDTILAMQQSGYSRGYYNNYSNNYRMPDYRYDDGYSRTNLRNEIMDRAEHMADHMR